MNRKQRRARKAAGQTSPDLQALLRAAREHAAAGDAGGAEVRYQAALAQAPREAECLFYYGTFLVDLGRHEEARRLLEGAAKARPTSVAVWANLAACQIATGDRKAAAHSAAKALERSPRDDSLRGLLREAVSNRPLDADETAAMSHLPGLVAAPGIVPAELLEPVISVFARSAGRLMAAPADADGEACCRAIAACAPLMALLPITLINDTALEAVLTAARNHLRPRRRMVPAARLGPGEALFPG